ncbi:MAG: NADPH-dependent FMN reductase [Candidatus Nanoarchaeia archaeon]
MPLHIAVIYGSTRSERQGIKAARFIVNELKKRKHEVKLVDPLEYKLPLLNKMHKEYDKGKAPTNLEKLHNIFEKADAYVIVSAEYNHTIPPALSNLIDHFMSEYFFKPSGIVSYSAGTFGGVRAAMTLRSLLAEVGMSSIPSTFSIPKVQDSFNEKGNDLTEKKDYERRIKKFLDELEWYANALKVARKKGKPY